MDFTYVSHIFYHPKQTFCASCDDYFPIQEFEWADTGECITDWYARYAVKFKGLNRILADELFVYGVIILGILVGGGIGFFVGNAWGIWGGIGGMIAGVIVVGFVGFVVGVMIKESVCRRLLGTEDFRSLL
jgi:hypothetical protein